MVQTFDPKEADIREIKLTGPMARVKLIRAKETYLLASRGSFKTTQGISLYLADCTYQMPQASGIICGPSFEHLGDNTLNPLFNSLTSYGLQEGVHFVIGQPPPKAWPRPFIRVPSKKYDHIISWHNGSNQYIISLAKKGSANGISCQYGVFDEAKFMDPNDLKEIVFPAFRGNEVYYKDHPLYLSKFFATDKLAELSKINWLLDKKDQNNYRLFDIIITLQLELDRLKLEYNDAGINKRYRMEPQIAAIETRLALLRKNSTLYIESNAMDSVQILGEEWLKDKKANTSGYVFDVAYMNADPTRPEDGFYPDFNKEKHTHLLDTDYDPDRPIILAADYQHSVSPVVLAQLTTLHAIGKTRNSLNFIDALYTLAPEGLEEALKLFCMKYASHKHKLVQYVFDQTATGRRNNADSYMDIVKRVLVANGWRVHEIYTGRQPGHYQRFMDTKAWFINEKGLSMDILMHADRCSKLIKSIERAAAKIGRKGETEKDKRHENTTQYPDLDQSETTHFSDVFDMILDAVLKKKLIITIGSGGGGGGVR
jgi:hypothetical protein